ncbi:MBL fold metallo-hydrolase [Actinomadura physcomitrii]|nr:MBL fold metallo-hydrolase [Actinomadura physcomitrii]
MAQCGGDQDGQALSRYALRADPVSTLAAEELRIGDRTMLALSDGFFALNSVPHFLGSPDDPHGFYEQMRAAGHDTVRMPIGAFVWPGERNALIDAGFGPNDHGGRGIMVGGMLPGQLSRYGLSFDDIHVIALSHLHPDHTGWLADAEGRPLFHSAQVVVGRADWDYFMAPDGAGLGLEEHVRHALAAMAEQDRVTLLDGDDEIVSGLTRLAAPGHTPGHSIYAVHDAGERALLFGDALYCPQQLTQVDWEASSDVDPVAARRTREAFLRDLEGNGGLGVGCHFPGLKAGRVLSGAWQER